jgi:hypothetical protein
MKFGDPDNEHMKFKDYLASDFGKLATPDKDGKDNPVFNAVVKWGKITSDQARSFIGPGSGPTVVLEEKSDKENLREFPYKLFVPPRLVEAFENKDKSATVLTGRGKTVLKVGVFMLEAIVAGSLGIFSQDNKDADPSTVNKQIGGFEAEAYGGIKGRIFVF